MAPLQKPSDNRPAVDDAVAISEDLLFEFFDFFDHSIDDVYAYIVHRTRVPEIAEDITLKLYFSLLQRQRFFWWRSRINLPELFLMADKAIGGRQRGEIPIRRNSLAPCQGVIRRKKQSEPN